jgi:hypothetical protein
MRYKLLVVFLLPSLVFAGVNNKETFINLRNYFYIPI